MRKIIFAVMFIVSFQASAEAYSVTVKRTDQNLYQVTSSNKALFIQTKYCYEYAYNDQAVLVYDRYSYNNKLHFNSGNSCDVEAILG